MANFVNERDGQIDFYQTFLPLINPNLSLDDILADDNDGVLNGNLLEFKLHINDLNAVLFQCIKYLSALRIKGKPVPANIVIIDLSSATAYLYNSEEYISDIEKVYEGSASKSNAGFLGNPYLKKLEYGDNQLDATEMIRILKENRFTKIVKKQRPFRGGLTIPGSQYTFL